MDTQLSAAQQWGAVSAWDGDCRVCHGPVALGEQVYKLPPGREVEGDPWVCSKCRWPKGLEDASAPASPQDDAGATAAGTTSKTEAEGERPFWWAEVYPDRADFEELKERYAATFDADHWCQLCGQALLAGELAWQLPPRRRGRSQTPWVCTDCFWHEGVPTPASVYRKLRFRRAQRTGVSLNVRELVAAIEALEPFEAEIDRPEMFRDLRGRVAIGRPSMNNLLAEELTEMMRTFLDVPEPDPASLVYDPWQR